MEKISYEVGSGNVFADIGFAAGEAAELSAKSALIVALKVAMRRASLTQGAAAELCGTDQPTLSKVFKGRMESITIDRLAGWLNALGQDVDIIVRPAPRADTPGKLRVVEAV